MARIEDVGWRSIAISSDDAEMHCAIGWNLSQPDSKYGYETVTIVVLPMGKHG